MDTRALPPDENVTPAHTPETGTPSAHQLRKPGSPTGKEADRLLDVKHLDLADVLLVAAGDRCDRCIGEVCAEH